VLGGFGVSRATRPSAAARDIRSELSAGQSRRAARDEINALPSGAQKWEGVNRLLDILEATSKREAAGSAGVAAQSAQGTIDKYQQWRSGQNLHELADILTDPAAGNRLRALARMPADSERARREAQYLWSLMKASRVSQTQEPRE
jgi:hypothetical protein